jgi:hypothetical protein
MNGEGTESSAFPATTIRPPSDARGRGLFVGGTPPMHRLLVLPLALALAACAGTQQPAQPSFYRDLTQPGETLDEAAAVSMFSDYRTKNGLPALSLDPALTDLARLQAAAMAKRDKLDHNIKRPFVQRLRKAGYEPSLPPRMSAPAITRWRKRSPAGAIPSRTMPTCSCPAPPAWASPRSIRRSRNTRFIGR